MIYFRNKFITDIIRFHIFNFQFIFVKILLYFGAIVPFSLLAILNFIIIYKATRFSRSKKPTTLEEIRRVKKRNEMIKTIVFITFLYIIVELPFCIFNGYFYLTVIVYDYGPTLNALFNTIEFTYPAFNIFILYFSNKLFAKELKHLFVLSTRNSRASTKITKFN